MTNKNALVFFADNEYLPGFRVLFKSIVKHNAAWMSQVDKILIADSTVETKEFEKEFIIRRIDETQYKSIKLDERFPYWHKTFFKLEIFDFPEYDRVVFLESDLLCTGDISLLFKMESPAEILGTLHVNKRWLSPAVLVLKKEIIQRRLKTILIEKAAAVCYDGDSPLINNYLLENPQITRELLPYEYNFTISYKNHWENINLKDVRIIHYAGVAKPWFSKLIGSFYEQYAKYIED